jgi:hypothetical protein
MKPEKLFKEINDLHAANIDHAQSTAQNAVIIGVKFHQLKEVLPHGEFEKAAQKQCKISDVTRQRYMIIAEERLIEQRAIKLLSDGNSLGGKSFTVKLLDDPNQQAIPVEIREQARAQVRSDDFKWTAIEIQAKDLALGLESTDIMALFRDYKAIRAKKPKQRVAPDLKTQIESPEPEPSWTYLKNDLLLLTAEELAESPTSALREFSTVLKASFRLVEEALKTRRAAARK